MCLTDFYSIQMELNANKKKRKILHPMAKARLVLAMTNCLLWWHSTDSMGSVDDTLRQEHSL